MYTHFPVFWSQADIVSEAYNIPFLLAVFLDLFLLTVFIAYVLHNFSRSSLEQRARRNAARAKPAKSNNEGSLFLVICLSIGAAAVYAQFIISDEPAFLPWLSNAGHAFATHLVLSPLIRKPPPSPKEFAQHFTSIMRRAWRQIMVIQRVSLELEEKLLKLAWAVVAEIAWYSVAVTIEIWILTFAKTIHVAARVAAMDASGTLDLLLRRAGEWCEEVAKISSKFVAHAGLIGQDAVMHAHEGTEVILRYRRIGSNFVRTQRHFSNVTTIVLVFWHWGSFVIESATLVLCVVATGKIIMRLGRAVWRGCKSACTYTKEWPSLWEMAYAWSFSAAINEAVFWIEDRRRPGRITIPRVAALSFTAIVLFLRFFGFQIDTRKLVGCSCREVWAATEPYGPYMARIVVASPLGVAATNAGAAMWDFLPEPWGAEKIDGWVERWKEVISEVAEVVYTYRNHIWPKVTRPFAYAMLHNVDTVVVASYMMTMTFFSAVIFGWSATRTAATATAIFIFVTTGAVLPVMGARDVAKAVLKVFWVSAKGVHRIARDVVPYFAAAQERTKRWRVRARRMSWFVPEGWKERAYGKRMHISLKAAALTLTIYAAAIYAISSTGVLGTSQAAVLLAIGILLAATLDLLCGDAEGRATTHVKSVISRRCNTAWTAATTREGVYWASTRAVLWPLVTRRSGSDILDSLEARPIDAGALLPLPDVADRGSAESLDQDAGQASQLEIEEVQRPMVTVTPAVIQGEVISTTGGQDGGEETEAAEGDELIDSSFAPSSVGMSTYGSGSTLPSWEETESEQGARLDNESEAVLEEGGEFFELSVALSSLSLASPSSSSTQQKSEVYGSDTSAILGDEDEASNISEEEYSNSASSFSLSVDADSPSDTSAILGDKDEIPTAATETRSIGADSATTQDMPNGNADSATGTDARNDNVEEALPEVAPTRPVHVAWNENPALRDWSFGAEGIPGAPVHGSYAWRPPRTERPHRRGVVAPECRRVEESGEEEEEESLAGFPISESASVASTVSGQETDWLYASDSTTSSRRSGRVLLAASHGYAARALVADSDSDDSGEGWQRVLVVLDSVNLGTVAPPPQSWSLMGAIDDRTTGENGGDRTVGEAFTDLELQEEGSGRERRVASDSASAVSTSPSNHASASFLEGGYSPVEEGAVESLVDFAALFEEAMALDDHGEAGVHREDRFASDEEYRRSQDHLTIESQPGREGNGEENVRIHAQGGANAEASMWFKDSRARVNTSPLRRHHPYPYHGRFAAPRFALRLEESSWVSMTRTFEEVAWNASAQENTQVGMGVEGEGEEEGDMDWEAVWRWKEANRKRRIRREMRLLQPLLGEFNVLGEGFRPSMERSESEREIARFGGEETKERSQWGGAWIVEEFTEAPCFDWRDGNEEVRRRGHPREIWEAAVQEEEGAVAAAAPRGVDGAGALDMVSTNMAGTQAAAAENTTADMNGGDSELVTRKRTRKWKRRQDGTLDVELRSVDGDTAPGSAEAASRSGSSGKTVPGPSEQERFQSNATPLLDRDSTSLVARRLLFNARELQDGDADVDGAVAQMGMHEMRPAARAMIVGKEGRLWQGRIHLRN
ncbi:hypothetical protein DXG03_008190 [Asterophora parasitica]|uniref:Uncharacterized protein n=1 Tax=Asterophora parasitica TaxID=117018 RepID=A0A9P7KE67_9AGAR|nr:hypothetical protein DXG03_008190 [Asterophora parasitica]